jgi:para-nitrobenzyl esterase
MRQRKVLRRDVLKGGLAAGGLALARRSFGLASACSDVVKTGLGALQGACAGDLRVFRGIPFAAPPVGKLRFRPPAAPAPWTGVRDATRFAAAALQPGEPALPQSEDCLYLNLWAPAGKGPFPVYVWIHGGGFTGGHAFEPVFDGSMLAREGVVCITVAYRLGVLGFLDVEPLLGAEYAGSANNGLRDLMAALTWVQQNVQQFGGDPRRVTIGGESAGAKLTDLLLGSDAAAGLFSQAISESGGAERIWPRQNALKIGEAFGAIFRQSSGVAEPSLLTAPGETLLIAQKRLMNEWPQHFPLRPEIDGTLFSELPVKAIAAGSGRGKRLLIGSNRDESALFVGPQPDHDASPAELGNLPRTEFLPVYAKYAGIYQGMTAAQRRIRALTAEEYWIPTLRVAEAQVAGGGSVWMYRLDFAEARGRLAGYAYHSLDVGLVWDRPHRGIGNDSAEADLAATMHAAWVAFLHGQTPAAPALPEWPAYRLETRETMILDVQSRVEQQPQRAEMELWRGVL